MARWYYVDGRQAAGPVDDDALRRLALAGQLQAASLVTPVGATAWSTLGQYEVELGLDRRLDGSYRPGRALAAGSAPAAGSAGPARPVPLRPAEPEPQAAPLRRRAAAALVDGVLFGLPALAVALLSDGVHLGEQAGRATVRFEAWGLGLTGLLALAYFGLLVGLTTQTPGKLALGLQVVDERRGGRLGAARGVARAAAVVIMAALCGLPLLVDLLWTLGDPGRRALHDRLVGSWVVDVR